MSAEEHSIVQRIKQLDIQLLEMRQEHDDVAVRIIRLCHYYTLILPNVKRL